MSVCLIRLYKSDATSQTEASPDAPGPPPPPANPEPVRNVQTFRLNRFKKKLSLFFSFQAMDENLNAMLDHILDSDSEYATDSDLD